MTSGKTNHDFSFAQRLARLRKAKGFTQAQLAKAVDVTQGLISLYENGTNEPSGPILAKLARALGESSDALLGLKPIKHINDWDGPTLSLWRRFQKMRMLPEQDQRAVIRLLNSLVTAKNQRIGT